MMFSALILAAAFYGLDFDPAATNSVTESRIYPVSSGDYRMVQPDGQVRMFSLVDAENGILAGPRPWVGKSKDNRIDIWADPDVTGGKLRTGFTFVAGRLRMMELDGQKYFFPQYKGTADLSTLFPERKKRTYAKNSVADIWNGENGRFRLWFANPNSAGALFALITLVCIWGLTRTRRYVRVVIGIAAAASVYGMFATGSRGALVAFVAGCVAIAAVYARSIFTRRGILIAIAGLLMLVAGMVFTGNSTRIINTFRSVDRGNETRLKISKAAVMMFADAPAGWQGGEVPGRNACLNWYVFDEARSLRTHIMSLAEWGWYKGVFYIGFWVFALFIGYLLIRKGSSLVATLWAAFFLAGFFNPVYIDWELWVLPMASFGLLAVRGNRLGGSDWRKCAVIVPAVSLVVLGTLIAVGLTMERPVHTRVKSCGAATFVNGREPAVWVVGDPLVMGGNGAPGREILAFYAKNSLAKPIAYVYSVDDLPKEADFVLVAGRNVPDYLAAFKEGRACKAKRLMMLSPSVGPAEVPEELTKSSKVFWMIGTLLASHDPSYLEKRSWVRFVPGCELYIPNWMAVTTMAKK